MSRELDEKKKKQMLSKYKLLFLSLYLTDIKLLHQIALGVCKVLLASMALAH